MPCSVSFSMISEVTHDGHPVKICAEASCVGRCGASSGDGRGWCSCDSRCWFLGDCCLDAPLHCFGATKNDISKTQPPADMSPDVAVMTALRTLMNEPITIDKITPSRTNLYKVQTIPLLTVAECTLADGNNECTSYEVSTKHHLPVCLPQLEMLFRNVFCARCNGFQSHEVVSFENWLEVCPEWLAFNYNIDELFHNETLVDLFYATCHQMKMFIPEACRSSVSRNHRYYTWPNTDAPACLYFANPMYIQDSNVKSIFKNQFCTDEPDIIRCVSSSANFDEYKTTLKDPLAVKVDSNGVLMIYYAENNADHRSRSKGVEQCGKPSWFLLSDKMIFFFLTCLITMTL